MSGIIGLYWIDSFKYGQQYRLIKLNGEIKVDDIILKMRWVHRLRTELQDHTSHPEDIYRPEGAYMRRIIYRKKIALLTRLEREIDELLTARLGKWKKDTKWDSN